MKYLNDEYRNENNTQGNVMGMAAFGRAVLRFPEGDSAESADILPSGLGGQYHFHYPYYEGGVCRHCYDYQFPRAVQAGLVDSNVQGFLASGR